MNKKGLGYLTYCIILIVLVVGFAVQQSPSFNIEGFKGNLTWTDVELNMEQTDLGNAFESFINGLGDAAFHIAKWAAQWASENPEVPFKLLIYLVLISILAPIIIVAFKLIVIVVILMKEFIQSRREKRELKVLKKKK